MYLINLYLPFVLLWTLLLNPLPASAENLETPVKAAYLERFLGYVDYDDPAAPSVPIRPLNICVYRDHDIFQALLQLQSLARNTANGLAYREVYSPESSTGCAIIFIGRSVADRLPETLSYFHGRPIVTVSDIPGFARRGGMIELIKEGPHVRFLINRSASRESGIKFRSQLLSLAREVFEQ